MTHYTKQEAASINDAWRALEYLCSCTNWSDTPALKDALKLEKQQAASDEPSPLVWARAMVLKAWLKGIDNPNDRARHFYHVRPGYLRAFLLGVGHAVERAGDDYTGPLVTKARDLAAKAVEANEAAFERMLEGV